MKNGKTLQSRLAGTLVVLAAAATAAQAMDLPIPMPAQAKLVSQQQDSAATYAVITGPIVQLGGIAGNIAATRTIDGQATQRLFHVTGEQTPGTLDKILAERLSQVGFDTVYRCESRQCGARFRTASPGYRVSSRYFGRAVDRQIYHALRRAGSNGDDYVAYQIAPDGDQLALEFDQVQSRPREVGAISVDAAQMAREISETGRVALYGLFFDTDSTQVKVGSDTTLGEIAKLLQDKPTLRLLVVGHTDNQGSFAYNEILSRKRASAVTDALVSEHGVDPARLKALGVGYSAPRASNDNAVGRTKNRRVELVPW